LIESDRGDVDARVEQRFRVVEEAFHARWSADSAAGTPGGAT
jgi:flagellar biosynthesis/type III secretory pathway protein FliH